MLTSIFQFTTVFVIYSIIGWIFETIVCSIQSKKFVFRGLLLGPWCPIYGAGAVLMLLASAPLVGSLSLPNAYQWPAVFVASSIIGTILEWLISGILKKLYGFQLWTYSDRKFNIQGRVALAPSIVWGLLGLVLVYLINIPVWGFTELLDSHFGIWFGVGLLAIFLTDFITSTVRLSAFRKITRAKSDVTEEYINYAGKQIRNKWIPNIRKFILKTRPNSEWFDFLDSKKLRKLKRQVRKKLKLEKKSRGNSKKK